jgi:hypothetical protein
MAGTPDLIEPYRPSNGTDGDIFMAAFCDRCRKRDLFGGCSILARALGLQIDDPRYPPEWVKTEAGPMCTAYSNRAEYACKPRRRHKPSSGQTRLF